MPIPLEVDTKQMVVLSLRDQLCGLPRFFPEGWNAAAGLVCAQRREPG